MNYIKHLQLIWLNISRYFDFEFLVLRAYDCQVIIVVFGANEEEV